MRYFLIGSGLGFLGAIVVYYLFLQNIISDNTIALVSLGFICTAMGGIIGGKYD